MHKRACYGPPPSFIHSDSTQTAPQGPGLRLAAWEHTGRGRSRPAPSSEHSSVWKKKRLGPDSVHQPPLTPGFSGQGRLPSRSIIPQHQGKPSPHPPAETAQQGQAAVPGSGPPCPLPAARPRRWAGSASPCTLWEQGGGRCPRSAAPPGPAPLPQPGCGLETGDKTVFTRG